MSDDRWPIIFVGQAPAQGMDPAEPFAGRCGRRLAHLCGMDLDEWMGRVHRCNVIGRWPGRQGGGDRFPLDEAREGAQRLRDEGSLDGRICVLLGGGVAAAFGLRDFEHFVRYDIDGLDVVVVPHPSGISRWWNEPTNHDLAAHRLKDLVREAQDFAGR